MSRIIILISGVVLLCLTIVNSYTSELILPSFQRAEVLSAASSLLLILIMIYTFNTPQNNMEPSFKWKDSEMTKLEALQT